MRKNLLMEEMEMEFGFDFADDLEFDIELDSSVDDLNYLDRYDFEDNFIEKLRGKKEIRAIRLG